MQNSRGKKLWILPNNNGDMPNDQLKHEPKKHWFKTFKKKKLTLDFDGLKKKKSVSLCSFHKNNEEYKSYVFFLDCQYTA